MEGYKLTGQDLDLYPEALTEGSHCCHLCGQLDLSSSSAWRFSRLQHNSHSVSQPRPCLKITWRGDFKFSSIWTQCLLFLIDSSAAEIVSKAPTCVNPVCGQGEYTWI